jgi:hypothetical protein
MSGFTRRTHVVRVTCPFGPGGPNGGNGSLPNAFVEIEVLDAISFKTTNGKDMILSLDSKDASAYIVDNTGDGNEKKPKSATRRSHMKRMGSQFNSTDPTAFNGENASAQAYDIEALDAIAFRGENGKVWILDMPQEDSRSFCVSDQTGDPRATRRTHLEEITSKAGKRRYGRRRGTPGGTRRKAHHRACGLSRVQDGQRRNDDHQVPFG